MKPDGIATYGEQYVIDIARVLQTVSLSSLPVADGAAPSDARGGAQQQIQNDIRAWPMHARHDQRQGQPLLPLNGT